MAGPQPDLATIKETTMKTLSTLGLAALALGAFLPIAPVAAGPSVSAGSVTGWVLGSDQFDRRPRVPGGSGCDDPRDVIEHPECR